MAHFLPTEAVGRSLSMFLASGLLAFGTLVAQPAIAAPAATPPRANYARVCEPEVKPAFLPLAARRVEPAGWLRDWAVAARDGITGHLDEYHPTFRDGWKGVPIDAPGAEPDGTGWPLEQCAYWLDGALRLGLRPARRGPDPEDPRPARPDRRRRQQGRFRHVVHLLEEGLQARGLQQLGPFADGPRPGGALPGHRRQAGARRPGQGLCRLSGEDGADPISCDVTRPVQPGRHAGDLFLQRRPADPRPRAGGHRPARGGQGPAGVGARPTCSPATWSSSTRTSACRPWSIPGPATGVSFRPRSAR